MITWSFLLGPFAVQRAIEWVDVVLRCYADFATITPAKFTLLFIFILASGPPYLDLSSTNRFGFSCTQTHSPHSLPSGAAV